MLSSSINKRVDVPKAPSVAIWMVTYNHEAFIAQAIESVMAQKTDFGYTLYIGEDCSTDNTRDICLRYKNLYPDNIELFLHEKNIGAVNNGLFMYNVCFSSGAKYIALLEGDDYWTDPYKLQKQVDYLDSNPECVVTYHDAFVTDERDNRVSESRITPEFKRDFSQEELAKSRCYILTLSMCFKNVLKAYPKNFLRAVNGDLILTSLLGKYGNGHYMDNILPSAFRIHGGGAWSMVKSYTRCKMSRMSFATLEQYYGEEGEKALAKHFKDCKLNATKTYLYESVHGGSTKDVFRAAYYSISDNRLLIKPKALFAVFKTVLKYLFRTVS